MEPEENGEQESEESVKSSLEYLPPQTQVKILSKLIENAYKGLSKQDVETTESINYFEHLPVELRIQILTNVIEDAYKSSGNLKELSEKIKKVYLVNPNFYGIMRAEPLKTLILTFKRFAPDPKSLRGKFTRIADDGELTLVRALVKVVNADDKGYALNSVLNKLIFYRRSAERDPILGEVIPKLQEMAKLLIDNGANVNMKTLFGDTSLLLAALDNNEELVTLLLNAGADVNFTKDNMTILELIEKRMSENDENKKSYERVAEILREATSKTKEIS